MTLETTWHIMILMALGYAIIQITIHTYFRERVKSEAAMMDKTIEFRKACKAEGLHD